jgi:Arc/MetJ-type ribon-helix-helix transcriptional regulator
MTVDVPAQFAPLVAQMVSEGDYADEAEVVAAALALLAEHRSGQTPSDRDAVLRAWAKSGFDQLDAGQSEVLDMESIKESARRRFLG